jgi:hypothetical protein
MSYEIGIISRYCSLPVLAQKFLHGFAHILSQGIVQGSVPGLVWVIRRRFAQGLVQKLTQVFGFGLR